MSIQAIAVKDGKVSDVFSKERLILRLLPSRVLEFVLSVYDSSRVVPN
jgi:hypothetical protein